MGWTNAYLSEQVLFIQDITITAGATGSSDVEGTAIDMQAYNCTSICFVMMLGALTTGGTFSMTAQQADNATFNSGNEDIEGTKQAIDPDADDNKILICDIIRPEKRYVRMHFDRATQAGIGACMAILYGFKELPVTQTAAGIVRTPEKFKDPVGGTA